MQLQEGLSCGSHSALGAGDHFQPPGGLDNPGINRFSRTSDTSSIYSGSDVMHSSMDDLDVQDADLSGLGKSLVGSDDEEGYAESAEVLQLESD